MKKVNSPLFELALVLVRFDHVARFIVNVLWTALHFQFAAAFQSPKATTPTRIVITIIPADGDL
jgi:hypothetical protein